MKTFTLIIQKCIKPHLLAFLFFNSLIMSAQVGIGTITPDASAELDITSTAKGVLVPRMSTAQKNAIVSPANGLLVFDTDQNAFYYFSTLWKKIDNNLLSDTDTDTKIEVEQSPDEDYVRIFTSGSERITVDNTGNVVIGDGTNHTKIEADGSFILEGTATVYEDFRVPVTSTDRRGVQDPAFTQLRNDMSGSPGIFAYAFDKNTEEELFFIVQLPHQWKEGTDIEPHIHWTAQSDVGTSKVRWGLEYTWTDIGEVFGNTQILYGENTIPSVGTVSAYEHAITSLGTISGTGKKVSSMLICRIFRDADASSDTFGNDAFLLEIDFHLEVDAIGSRTEYQK